MIIDNIGIFLLTAKASIQRPLSTNTKKRRPCSHQRFSNLFLKKLILNLTSRQIQHSSWPESGRHLWLPSSRLSKHTLHTSQWNDLSWWILKKWLKKTAILVIHHTVTDKCFFLLNLLYNPSKVISFLVAMKTTSGSIKRATSVKKNFGEIIILASRFHVISQWRVVQNRPVSHVCFVPNRHQSKKSSFLLHSDLYFAACPLSKNEQLACVQIPLPSGKIYFSWGRGVCTQATKKGG